MHTYQLLINYKSSKTVYNQHKEKTSPKFFGRNLKPVNPGSNAVQITPHPWPQCLLSDTF